MGGEGKTNFWSFDHSPMTLARGGKQMGLCAAFGVENILIAPFAFKYYFFSTAGFLSRSSIASQCRRIDPIEVSVYDTFAFYPWEAKNKCEGTRGRNENLVIMVKEVSAQPLKSLGKVH